MANLNAFIGNWQEESKEGFDEVASALGLPVDQKKLYKETRTKISYSIDGDTWAIDVGSVGAPSRTFSFKLGQEYQSTDIDGTPLTSFVNSTDGTTLDERHKFDDGDLKGCEMEINRKIEDGTMLVKTTICGKSMISKYKKE